VVELLLPWLLQTVVLVGLLLLLMLLLLQWV
jgi:hypothetical protein